MTFIILLSLIGIALCLYGLYVERQIAKNPSYKAACDLSDRVSCSKTMRSNYSALLGISNNYVGLVFYIGLAIIAFLGLHKLVFLAALGAIGVSFYLAYIQYGKLKTFCLLCSSLYIVNLLILFASYR